MVEAVKGVKHLKKNLVKFLQQDNPFIIKKYNRLRRLIVKVTREIDVYRGEGQKSGDILALDQLKLDIEEKIEAITNRLDGLIRNDQIDIDMATSLMNDISYCSEICWGLIDASAVLFASHDRSEKAAMMSIALDEDDISEILENRDKGVIQ